MIELSLLGRLSFQHTAPTEEPLSPGRNLLGIAEERDTILYVPEGVEPGKSVPLMCLFHGAGGQPEKMLPFLEKYADKHGFLILAPYSQFITWDITIAGNGPDLERLGKGLTKVASHFLIDREHVAFAGFSDGASYSLSNGLTNGNLVTHVIAFSGGFMSVLLPEGQPKVFIAHGLQDEQLPTETSARVHAEKLKQAGYETEFVEFEGNHSIQPAMVELAVDFFMRDRPSHNTATG